MLVQRTKRGFPPVVKTASVPAPTGLNLVDTASELPASDCVVCTNMLRGQYGLRTRSGYREWVTGLGGDVRTIMAFRSADGATDALFACTADGIYDVTGTTSTPTQVYAFPASDANSGYGAYKGFVNLAGGHYLLYADQTNGYIVYDGATWTKIAAGLGGTDINGHDPGEFVHVALWKNRVWFAQKDSSVAWYTGTAALYGDVTAFDFGPQFRHGGTLVGIWNLSIDGGFGIDDYLVALSSAGDLVIYEGTDPDTPGLFELSGTWYLGPVPTGHRFITDIGGDALVLSQLGVIPISKIKSGAITQVEDSYASRKISPALSDQLTDLLTSRGWEIRIHPEDKALIVTVPYSASTPSNQWLMSLHSQGWSYSSGIPMATCEEWKGKLYFGTSDGRVCINDGDADEVTLTGLTDPLAIQWSLITAFSSLGVASNKRLKQIRPRFITGGDEPQYSVEARYDFDLSEITSVTYVTPTTTAAVWDSAIWDSSVWAAGATAGTAGEWRGAAGMGTYAAIALAGASKARTTLVAFECFYDVGGSAL